MDLNSFTMLPSIATIILTDAQIIPSSISGGLFMTPLVSGSLAGGTRCSKFIFMFPAPVLEFAISAKSSGCFQWRMNLETTVLALRVVIDSRLLGRTELGK